MSQVFHAIEEIDIISVGMLAILSVAISPWRYYWEYYHNYPNLVRIKK